MSNLMQYYSNKMATTLSRRIDKDIALPYVIPKEYKLTKNGVPDRRYKNHKEAKKWLKEYYGVEE